MIVRFVLYAILIYLIYRIVKSILQTNSYKINKEHLKSAPAISEDLVEDPACHTYIPVTQAYRKEIAGKNYYFCSKECCEGYLSGKSKETQ
jgi:uncharacterized protein